MQGNNVFHGTVKEVLAGALAVETAVGTCVVPRPVTGPAPAPGAAVSFSVRAEQITDAPMERHANRLSAVCTAVEYFGAVRRHIFPRTDGEVLKYDQFGAQAARIAPGQTVQLGWTAQSSVLHSGSPNGGSPNEGRPA